MKLVCKKEGSFKIETYSIKEVLAEGATTSTCNDNVLIEVTDKFVEVARLDMSKKLIELNHMRYQKAYFSKVGNEWGLVLFTDSNDTIGYFNNDDNFYDSTNLTELNVQVIKSLTQLEEYTNIVFQRCNNVDDCDVELLCMYYRFLNVRNECIQDNTHPSNIVRETLEYIGFGFTDYQSMVKGYLSV